jgi:hypothetical protein
MVYASQRHRRPQEDIENDERKQDIIRCFRIFFARRQEECEAVEAAETEAHAIRKKDSVCHIRIIEETIYEIFVI